MSDKNHLIVTVSGKDKPGITAAFTRVVARRNATIVDIDQATVHDILTLSLLLDLSQSSNGYDVLLEDLMFEADRMGMKLDHKLLSKSDLPDPSRRCLFVLTVFGGTRPLAETARILGEAGVNIDTIANIGNQSAPCVELTVDVRNPERLRQLKERLMTQSHALDIDFAIQRVDAYRKSKRLVVFDMDRTLVTTEIIDEMAAEAGCHREVADLTNKAMRGDLDFEESLRQRTALLKGLPVERLEKIRDRLQLSSGIPEIVRTLKHQGYKIGLVSGGFDLFARSLEKRLELDFAYANNLEIENGLLTGRVNGVIIDGEAKANIFMKVSEEFGVPPDQTVAIGDGANDRQMLERAGLGIAYNAKTSLALAASMNVGKARLKNILYILGITSRDIRS